MKTISSSVSYAAKRHLVIDSTPVAQIPLAWSAWSKEALPPWLVLCVYLCILHASISNYTRIARENVEFSNLECN